MNYLQFIRPTNWHIENRPVDWFQAWGSSIMRVISALVNSTSLPKHKKPQGLLWLLWKLKRSTEKRMVSTMVNPTFGLLLVAQTSEKVPMFQQFGW